MVPSAQASESFTLYSRPVELRYGEVHNRVQWNSSDPMHFPKDVVERYASGEKVVMAISGWDVDMVRLDADGRESQVRLDDHYLHHYILHFGEASGMRSMFDLAKQDHDLGHSLTGCHGMRGAGVRKFKNKMRQQHGIEYKGVDFGSAAGAEYRHNPQRFDAPFRLVLEKPEVWAPELHIINTNLGDNFTRNGPVAGVSPLLECPCTPQRKIDVAAGTIDGKPANPPIHCSKEFAATGNPSCHLSTYVGGWRCCEHGVFLIDTDKYCKLPNCAEKHVDKVYMKYTFFYDDAEPDTRDMEPAACCDVTSDTEGDENIEHDVPACPQGTSPENCIYVAESVQPLGYYYPDSIFHPNRHPRGSDLVDLVFAAPHLHYAGLSLLLMDAETNKTLCEVHRTSDNSAGVIYGRSSRPGDEDGYLVGLTPCIFGSDAPRFRRDHLMYTRAVYNASRAHTGVMSLWLNQVSAVPTEAVVV